MNLLLVCATYVKLPLKNLRDGEGPESAPKRKYNYANRDKLNEKISPRLNTHDSIGQNSISITGAAQTTNISPRFKTFRNPWFNQSNQPINILLQWQGQIKRKICHHISPAFLLLVASKEELCPPNIHPRSPHISTPAFCNPGDYYGRRWCRD